MSLLIDDLFFFHRPWFFTEDLIKPRGFSRRNLRSEFPLPVLKKITTREVLRSVCEAWSNFEQRTYSWKFLRFLGRIVLMYIYMHISDAKVHVMLIQRSLYCLTARKSAHDFFSPDVPKTFFRRKLERVAVPKPSYQSITKISLYRVDSTRLLL